MLGFTLDWGDEPGGIAGVSRGSCRLFLTNRRFRESYGNTDPILIWLNESKAGVDHLFVESKAGASNPKTSPAVQF